MLEQVQSQKSAYKCETTEEMSRTYTHTNQVLCFPYLKLFQVSVCSRGEGYQNISSFCKLREIEHENTMDRGRKIRR